MGKKHTLSTERPGMEQEKSVENVEKGDRPLFFVEASRETVGELCKQSERSEAISSLIRQNNLHDLIENLFIL